MGEFLKCDTEGCDHVEQVGTITAEMVERPCPVCGSSLLTQDDWNQWSSVISPMLKAVVSLSEGAPEGGSKTKVSVHVHNQKLTVIAETTQENE